MINDLKNAEGRYFKKLLHIIFNCEVCVYEEE